MKHFLSALGGVVIGALIIILYMHFTTIKTAMTHQVPEESKKSHTLLSDSAEPHVLNEVSYPGVESDITKAVERIMPSVVYIDTKFFMENEPDPIASLFGFSDRARTQPREGRGSGFVISKDGLIITNEHVVHGANEILVTFANEKSYKATVKGADPMSDLAVLKIEADDDLVPAVLGDSDKVKIGEGVIAVGSPYHFQQTVTYGILSGRGRTLSDQSKDFADLLQTDAAINPGNSGGPLVNSRGEVIGINTAIIPYAQGIGFAIAINTAKNIADQLLTQGHVSRPYLGVMMRDLNSQLAAYLQIEQTQGILIVGVQRQSPAQEAGLRIKDIITGFDGQEIKKSDDLRNMLKKVKIGDTVNLKIIRDDREISVAVKVGERENNQ